MMFIFMLHYGMGWDCIIGVQGYISGRLRHGGVTKLDWENLLIDASLFVRRDMVVFGRLTRSATDY